MRLTATWLNGLVDRLDDDEEIAPPLAASQVEVDDSVAVKVAAPAAVAPQVQQAGESTRVDDSIDEPSAVNLMPKSGDEATPASGDEQEEIEPDDDIWE
jgi:hypothetical protein